MPIGSAAIGLAISNPVMPPDAAAKATTLSEAASVTLGPLMAISEGGGGAGPFVANNMMRMESAQSVPVAGGEIRVSVQVTMVYAIGD